MFLSKAIGNFRRHTKAVTCAILAISILAATFITAPFGSSADGPEKADTKDAVFVGRIGADNCAGTFIPVDIVNGNANLYSGVTWFKLRFECRMLSGNKPIIGVLRVDASNNTAKTYAEPSWCDNANDVTVSDGVCTAYFKVDFKNRTDAGGKGMRSFYITVGNAEHNGTGVSEKDNTVSFIMSDATLVACDSYKNVIDETNRLPEFTADNIDFGGVYYTRSDGCSQWDCPAYAESMKWHMDSNSFAVKHITVPNGFCNSPDYDAANFTLHAATDTVREYYTNEKYSGLYFEKLSNSNDKGFAVISDDLNKKFVFIDANRNGEADDTTSGSYAPQKNKVGNIFLPLSLGQYSISGSSTSNSKVLLKVTFKANLIEGDGPPVIGRVVAKPNDGTGCWAWGLSTINARGSGYYVNYDRSDNGGGIRPQCTYDPETGEYVGWVGMELANSEHLTTWGTSEVLTIGNAEHVYQTGVFDSTSFNSSFSIQDIKVDLYSATQNGNTFTPAAVIAEDIAPSLTADNIDADGEWFFDYKNGVSKHDKDLIRASQQKWHIDGEKSLVSFINIDEISAYSTKYSLVESGATGVLSAYTTLESSKTYQYVFKSKYESSAKAKPFIEFVTSSGTKKYDGSNYVTDKGNYYNTVISFKTPSNLVDAKNVRVGIDFASVDINGTFGGFEIFEIGTDGMAVTDNNLLRKIFLSEGAVVIPFSDKAQEGVWTKDGNLGTGSAVFNIVFKDDGFYKKPTDSKMLVFSGTNSTSSDPEIEYKGGDGKLSQTVRIETGKKYRLTANLKNLSTGIGNETIGITVNYYNKSGTTKKLTGFTDLSDENLYLFKYEFDAPTSLLKIGNNFKITLNVPNGYVSGYFANACLQEIDGNGNTVGDNLFSNGDFATGDTYGWEKSGSFNCFRFCGIPENFFTKNPGHNIHALQYRDTADYTLLQQMVQVKPNTNYRVEYTSLITGLGASTAPYGVLYQKMWETDERIDSSWTYLLDNDLNPGVSDPAVVTEKKVLNLAALGEMYDSSDSRGQAIRVTKTFKTSERLRVDTTDNLSVRFYFMSGSSGYISDFAVYELDEKGNVVGNNVIIDGDFTCGDEVFSGKTVWRYSNEGNVRNIELEKGFFENYTFPKEVLRSDGSFSNGTYGNTVSVNPKSRFYFSGNYVKTNFVGINPQIYYKSVAAGGDYVSLPVNLYFDSTRYYFETQDGFIIPDDAVIDANGKASIIVQVNNLDHGKGYFCNLSLTENDSSKNLFDNSKASMGKFKALPYDPEIFMPFEGDEKFEDVGWSGEEEPVLTGEINGRVYDDIGLTLPGVKMLLNPGEKSVYTDDFGVYRFEKLNPGKYTVYLVESGGYRIYCCEVEVEAGVSTALPDIYYTVGQDTSLDIDDNGEVDIDTDSGVKKKKYGTLQGYCYSPEGKLLSGIDIYANTKKLHVKTDEKGRFEFEKLAPGEYKICTLLDDGSTYVFKTVKIEAGKKLTIKIMMPNDEETFPVWALIAIIAGGAVLLAGIALLTVFLILKKKKNALSSPVAEAATPAEIQ